MYKFYGTGRTYWESSYFGGVKRILTEYPFHKINYDLYVFLDQTSLAYQELNIYQQEKLVNILFNQAFSIREHKHNFKLRLQAEIENILKDPKRIKEHTVTHYSRQRLKVPIPKDVIKSYITLSKKTELSELFTEYETSLTMADSQIVIMMDPPNNSANPPKTIKADSSKTDGPKSPILTKGENRFYNMSEKDIALFSSKKAMEFVNSFKDHKNVENFSVSVVNVEKGYSTSISKEQIIFAKKMAQLLDITHDPTSDVVKNLVQGNIDSEKLAEILSGNNKVYMNRLEKQMCKPFKVIVVGDYSGSMRGMHQANDKIGFQKKVMKSMFYLFNNLLNIDDIEFYGHSGNSDPILYRFHSPEYPHFLNTIDTDDIDYSENYDGPILEHIHKMVRAKCNKPVLLISLSDGSPAGNNYGGDIANKNMKRILEKIKRDNFVTVGIGMLYSVSEDLYQYYVSLTNLTEVSPVSRIINRAVKENLILED